MRSFALGVAFLLLLTLGAPLLAAQGPGTGPGTGPGAPRGGERERVLAGEEARDWANLSETARERGLARAEDARLFAGMTWSNGMATSRFVSFGYANGSLSDFAVRSGNDTAAYFTSVDVAEFGAAGAPAVAGSVLRAMSNESFFAAHANPLGLFSYRVRNVALDMTFTFAEGVNATNESARSFMLTAAGGAHGHVILTANAAYTIASDNRSATVTLGPHARLLFLHHAQQTTFTSTLHALRDAAAADRVGGVLSIVADAEGPVQDRIFLSGVTMRATHARDGRAEVVVSSDSPAPRAVIINLDPTVLGVGGSQELTVTLDGQPVDATATAAEALGSSSALAHVNASAIGVQVIVAVPGFSDHTIAITADAEGTPTVTPSPTATGAPPTATATPTPTGNAPTSGDLETPAPAVALLLALVGVAAIARRRRG